MTATPGSRLQAATAAILVDGDLDAVDTYFAADYVAHGTGGARLAGPGAVRTFIGAIRRAFPELDVDVELLVESRDRVAWQRSFRGVQRGALQGFPASGREIVWRDMGTSRFRDGLIAEDWVITDLAEQLLRARKR